MKKYFKTLLSVVSLASAIVPMVALVSCGSKTTSQEVKIAVKPEVADKKNEENLIMLERKEIKSPEVYNQEKWGIANYANWEITKSESKNLNEVKERNLTGEPFALHFHPRDLKNWSADKDADEKFNKSTISLQKRQNAETFSDSQKDYKLDILEGLHKDTSGSYLGTVNRTYDKNRVYSMWQNVNAFTEWGGSASEGLIVVPKGEDINAAHKNGVPMYGVIFTPPQQFGGNETMYDELFEQDGNKFVIADKLVELAKYYGFDGWFLNFETPTTRLGTLGNFADYLYDKCNEANMFTELYAAGSGRNISGGKHSFLALDYGEDPLTGISRENLFMGYDMGPSSISNRNSFDKSNSYVYGYYGVHDPVMEGDDFDLQFHSDSEGSRDPRIGGNDQWLEASKAFKQKTVINRRDNFSTSFQIGFGKKWFDEGKVIPGVGSYLDTSNDANAGWRNIGIQSILPTWRYINDVYDINHIGIALNRSGINVTPVVSEDGTKWHETMKETEGVYHGSSSLVYEGKIDSNKIVVNKLYGTNVVLKEGDEFSIIYKNLNDQDPKIRLAIWDKTYKLQRLISPSKKEDLKNGFKKIIFRVHKSLNDYELSSVGFAFSNENSSAIDVNVAISKFSIAFDKTEYEPQTLNSLSNDGVFKNINNPEHENIRLSWETNKSVDHWAIYKADDKTFDKSFLIGLTSNHAAFVQDITKEETRLIIEGYDGGGNLVVKQNAILKS